ncbi:MAG TPA: Tim44/TimA family putative adaptor protein [Rhizomicrobium sp.]|jgi:predicted lipid-binding transport protein (Tim44 family)
MANSQLLSILLIAMVAGIILFRLYTVLGRRTGNERPRPDPFQRAGAAPETGVAERAMTLPDRTADTAASSTADPVAQGLLDIKLADRGFETEHFVEGARKAYEMIVTAFAKGDRTTLRPLLGDDVYAAFDSAIAAREQKHESMEFTFVGMREAKVTGAQLKKNFAEVTISFTAQFISATKDGSGAIVDGDPKAVRDVVDVWTFERNVRASDPNWRLVATSGEAGEPKAG